MTNAEKFKEVFGCTLSDIIGYADRDIETEIWEEQEYNEPELQETLKKNQ